MKNKCFLTVLAVAGIGAVARANGVDCPSGNIVTQTVPDGGTTAMLLGGALAGLGLIKKKFLS
jgi:hypothetical protein